MFNNNIIPNICETCSIATGQEYIICLGRRLTAICFSEIVNVEISMSGSVKAVYNYTYVYEGTKISFKKDEEFQLLAKSNKDWWQVRRWGEDGCAHDIYVPAVYVKEVKTEIKKKRENLYQNITDIRKQIKGLSTENGEPEGTAKPGKIAVPPILAKPRKGVDPPPQKPTLNEGFNKQTSPVMSPVRKKPLQARMSLDHLISSDKTEKTNGVDLSTSQPVSSDILLKLSRPTYKKPEASVPPPSSNLPPPATNPKPRSRSVTAEAKQEADAGSGVESTPVKAQSGPVKVRLPPPVLPKSQKPVRDRPKSMVVMSPTSDSPPNSEPQVSVGAIASELESAFARQVSNHSTASSGEGAKRPQSASTKRAGEIEASRPGEVSTKALNLRKTPSPKTDFTNLPVTVSNMMFVFFGKVYCDLFVVLYLEF